MIQPTCNFTSPTPAPTPVEASLSRPRGRFLSILFALSLAAAAHAQFNGPPSGPGLEINRPFVLTTDPDILHPPPHESPLQPGDQITVKIYGDSDYLAQTRIGSTGDVYLPLAGLLHFGGLTVGQASDLLSAKLDAAGMYHNAAIGINSTDGPNQVITIIGEAHGIVPSIGNKFLLETLAGVGGLPPTASHVITINRRGATDPIIVDIGNDPLNTRQNDIPLFAGDTVITSRIGVVYVIGEFKQTGTVAMNSYGPLTLTELSALSGGTTLLGKYSDLRIIRTVGNRRTVSVVNIKDIKNGKAPDPILEPNDIVYLAPSTFKSIFLGGTITSIISYASLAISLSSIR